MAPTSSNAMVEIKSVVKSFGDVKAVNGADTIIREGEFFSCSGLRVAARRHCCG